MQHLLARTGNERVAEVHLVVEDLLCHCLHCHVRVP